MDLGIIVDLETTGLDATKDEIIEIGLLQFAVFENEPPKILAMFSGLSQPTRKLDQKIRDLTGLSDEILVNRKIDWAQLAPYFSSAAIVISHNIQFDAPFLRRIPEIQALKIHWGCSKKHIDWPSYGFKTRALNYLAADHGFLNPFAHRALFDCATTFRLIAPYLDELIERSYENEYLLSVVNSPFDTRHALKEKGYFWDSEKRCWCKQVFESSLEEEREFLKNSIYPNRKSLHVEERVLEFT